MPYRPREARYAAILAKYNIDCAKSPILDVTKSAALASQAIGLEQLKLSDRKIALTIAHAVEYTQLPVFRGERTVGNAWAQHLLDEMMRGEFNWDLVVLGRCEVGDRTFKVNGQHTAWARIAADLTPDPKVREIVYRVDTEEQLRRVYRSFDRAKVKSDGHLMQVELLGQDLDPAITKEWATLVANGVKLWKFENVEAYRKIDGEQIAAMVGDPALKPLYTLVCLFCQGTPQAHSIIRRQATAAAMLETFGVDAAAAASFWGDVAEGTNLVKHDARYLLHNYLGRAVLAMKSRLEDRQVVHSEEMYRVCVHLWNKWRDGVAIDVIRPLQSRPEAH